jgi:metallo-beta-lactamase family protein
MLDSAKIQESDAEYDNRKRRPGQPLVQPLYTAEDAARAGGQLRSVEFGRDFAVAAGVGAHFLPAGHILGAAAVRLELQESGRRVRLGFSGDLGRYRIPLLEDPAAFEDVDVLLLESTYGDRLHMAPELAYERLHDLARDCFERGGKLLIPSFAMGRAQELIYAFHRLFDEGRLPRVPVYLDSPLAARLTEVFRAHLHEFDEESRAFMSKDDHESPLDYPEVRYIEAVEDSIALNDAEGPMVIVSPSGMLTGGRVRHHLRNTVGDRRNMILIVSWQAPGTLGRRLVERAETVRLFGQDMRVHAQVEVINGFSAHADRAGLVRFATQVGPRLRRLALVHGEPKSAAALEAAIPSRPEMRVTIPALGESLEF